VHQPQTRDENISPTPPLLNHFQRGQIYVNARSLMVLVLPPSGLGILHQTKMHKRSIYNFW